MWVQARLKDYPIPMTNFSTCWNDGLAFCALIHVFYPDNFDWFALDARDRRHNFTLGFEKAEELAGIYPLLEVDDMVKFKKPDWKCVFTYVQSFYRRFRDGRSPPPRSGFRPTGQAPLSPVAQACLETQEAERRARGIVEQVSQMSVAAGEKKISQDNPFTKAALEEEEEKSQDKKARTKPASLNLQNSFQPIIPQETSSPMSVSSPVTKKASMAEDDSPAPSLNTPDHQKQPLENPEATDEES